jgi:hypothetical protein
MHMGFGKSEPTLWSEGSAGRLGQVALGVLAAAAVAVAVVSSPLTGQPSNIVGLCANLLLVAFALANARRPYARFWWPSTTLLLLVGLIGACLTLIPAPSELVTAAGLTHFGLSSARSAAQLGAVATTALAWSTAGRRPLFARNSLLLLSILAALQLLAALLAGYDAGKGLAILIELCFALWLFATAVRTWRARTLHRISKSSDDDLLAPERWETLHLAGQYGDFLR